MTLEANTCYRALCARDARFDGLFFVGVSTTGVYCRPVCPARTPGRDRCRFFRTAAEAERDGFRACFRCRPELAPGGAPVDALPRLVASAVARIASGRLDGGAVDGLAAELGVSDRHLRRAMTAALGVSPIDVAQTRRLAVAKQLLHDTALPLAEVALASGFASVRRFNALFRARFGRPPSAVRREHGSGEDGAIALRLDHRPPLDWAALLAFLRPRATPGVESIEGGVYRRTVAMGGRAGWIAVRPERGRPALRVEVAPALAGALVDVAGRVRALADLDARPAAIDAHLRPDRLLGPLVARHPGLRVPGAFDGFEVAVRAVLGQQVSVRGATTIAGRLVERFGAPVTAPVPALRRLFPAAEVLAAATERDVATLGMPGARARTVIALARAVAREGLRLDRLADPEETVARLEALPGIGPWTAQVVALRALGWPDAFPAGDLGLRAALGGSEREALRRAERWRPWRAYAALHLWTLLTEERP
ncbi:DNA-3-methyladenine glycosylase 2 family protein [Anaeromyxobacter oryzae]|uniref:DNA-3-methyladenine glycosylase II n=1 Tax=Anaeromyxobacter oryzae TaxID=2918170 RepID=A0ABN6MQ79_9BACT|nr:DNA-3-methyladenine glycosylase 2 [Anaeromyxobacter oryzae]BDG03167.1 AraC family transcriptional regulator [Anaeromyxobacter oryzae]